MSKPDMVLGGRTLLDATLRATAGARDVVVVGGPQPEGVTWTVEEPRGSGPAAAVAAGMQALRQPTAPWVCLLAVDMPRVADAIDALLAARDGDGAWVVDGEGKPQPLLAVYRADALVARLDATTLANGSMRRLTEGLTMQSILDRSGVSRDVDTWADVNFWKETLE